MHNASCPNEVNIDKLWQDNDISVFQIVSDLIIIAKYEAYHSVEISDSSLFFICIRYIISCMPLVICEQVEFISYFFKNAYGHIEQPVNSYIKLQMIESSIRSISHLIRCNHFCHTYIYTCTLEIQLKYQ